MTGNQPRCQRPGCSRNIRSSHYNGKDFDTCSRECDSFLTAYEQAHALADTLGPSELTDKYLVGVRRLMTLWDEVQRTRAAIRKQARSVGITGDAWGSLLRGEYEQAG
jgi:hypothetical protein